MLKLPVSTASFEIIREDGYLYVDKTRHIFRMVDEGIFYFMSRPRRFGKSLTVSTLKCLFQGRKELFEGLWIKENTNWQWKAYPIISIDFNEIAHDTTENFKQSLEQNILRTAKYYDVNIDDSLLIGKFASLIPELNRKTGMRVVVLFDEYDKPIIEHIGKGEKSLDTAKKNRDILRSFLGVLKGTNVSSALKFVFITGVSKFTKVSIFSELNNLKDITMNEDYADMLGYNQEEIETCFAPYIDKFSKERGLLEIEVKNRLKHHYNGYRFSEKNIKVYNPFSVLKSLDEKAFKNYWFETGTPIFLINLLTETNWYLPKIEDMKASESVFSTYEIDKLKPEALLFQTGYVTISDVKERLYTFGYPNQEVKTSFLEMLFHSYTQGVRDSSQFVLLSGYLQHENFEVFFETISAIFASIPYVLETKRDEAYFHTIFYLIVCASGIDAQSEILTCTGRIDLVMEFVDKIFIIEFKCNQNAELGIKQIQEKKYDQKYRQNKKKIILMGINFDIKKRNVEEWKVVFQEM